MMNIETIEKKGSWMTYRPDIKVLDCTIRDGGLVNNFKFDEEFVKNLYQCCINSGVDYMEIGYKSSRDLFIPTEYGPWKFCNEDDIKRITDGYDTSLKLSVMVDVDRVNYKSDILTKEQSRIDMIRIATYIHQVPSAIDMVKDAHDKGYETSINLMAISLVNEKELDEALSLLASSEVDIIYLVDSFGALYTEQIRALTRKYLKFAEDFGKSIGIHAHNNQQLAYANTIEALILGASYLDATISGLGRGAGNCPIELLIGFLKNPKYNIRPILKFIQQNINNLKNTGIIWGYDIPYMLTGQLNLHPRMAIDFINSNNDDYISFYDKLANEI